MKIVYFGTDVFLSCFSYFAKHHEILALYTYHRDEDYFTEYSIVKKAGHLGIPVHYEDISEERICRYFLEEQCGLFFAAEYDRLLPVPVQLGQFRGINIHCSLLPEGRSYYPIEAAMERSLEKSGVTMHKITTRLDGGQVLDSSRIEGLHEMDSIDVYLQCGAAAEVMLRSIMEDFEGCWEAAREQGGGLSYPYWKRPCKEKLTITHEMTTGKARDCFWRYNQLTEAVIDGQAYYIRALEEGTASIKDDVIAIREDQVLFRTADGHVRLILCRKGGRYDGN